MKAVSSYSKVKRIFLFEIFVIGFFLIVLSYHSKKMGFHFFLIGFGLVTFYGIITYLKNYFYRALFIDLNNNYYILKLLTFKKRRNYVPVDIVSVKKLIYPKLYKVEVLENSVKKIYYTTLLKADLIFKN